jgi:hypothetical protein
LHLKNIIYPSDTKITSIEEEILLGCSQKPTNRSTEDTENGIENSVFHGTANKCTLYCNSAFMD